MREALPTKTITPKPRKAHVYITDKKSSYIYYIAYNTSSVYLPF